MRVRFVQVVSLGVVLVVACSGDSYGPSTTYDGGPRTVDALPTIAFSPDAITVAPGDTVTFAFGSVAHDVYFDPMPGAPADIPGAVTGQRVPRVFAAAGRYPYSCHIHPGMRGTVLVDDGK